MVSRRPAEKAPTPRRTPRKTSRETIDPGDVLAAVGRHVLALRAERKLSQSEVARRCGVSGRFLGQLENGANVSLATLVGVANGLGVGLDALLHGHGPVEDEVLSQVRAMMARRGPAEVLAALSTARALLGSQDGTRVALLGIRGAGKTTIGGLLARALGVPFVELDERVERGAGMSIGSVFELHGEAHYRALERAALTSLLADERSFVVATGGSIVTDAEQYDLLQRSSITVWLRATPEDHWKRVVAQGDARPMRENPQAMDELRALFAARLPLYERAKIIADTTLRSPQAVAAEIAARVRS